MADDKAAPAGEAGERESARTEPQTGAQPRTFSQEEVNQLVEQRLSRQKAQYKDYEEYKQSAQRLAELEAQNQTETEKLRAVAEKARKDAETAAEREKAALARANDTLIRAAVVSEASRQQAIDPEAVYALLDRSKLTVGDGDQVNGIEDAITALLSERAYLAGARPRGGFDGGARETAAAVSSNADFNDAIRRQAGFA